MSEPSLPPELEEQLFRIYFGSSSPMGADAFDDLCNRHPEHADLMRSTVERLADIDGVLGTEVPGELEQPAQVGGYRIVSVLGEGGMGTVYLAEQEDPVRRQVALKVIKLGMDTKAVLARFELERRSLAVMNHDCIARVFDAGTTERGQPYFVMEHVDGLPITEHCDRHGLAVNARIRLFQDVCHGVQHAHQKGVIHRDLKPSNILVSERDGRAVPKIIDFGLARATEQAELQMSMFTQHGQLVGTPLYMSPEQADLMATDIDTRSDVYSLGVVLYELLVGVLPHGNEPGHPRLSALRHEIRHAEAPRPSARISMLAHEASAVASQRGTSPSGLRRVLRADLDWVVLKAMEKDRGRRYETAAALALDLGRFLAHEPLEAGPPSPGYRLKKFVRRYRGQVVAAALIFTALTVGLATSLWFAGRFAQKVQEFDQLAGVVHYDTAIAGEEKLYPAWPTNIEAMRSWLDMDAARLLAMRSRIQSTLDDLETHTVPSSGGAPSFDEESQQFLYDTLTELRSHIEDFEAGPYHAVTRRLFWAEKIGGLTEQHPRARHSWAQARAAIAAADGVAASRLYAADRHVDHPIDLPPQTGLVPIGRNPVTGLWEFYHLRAAWNPDSEIDPAALPIPEHRPDGTIEVDDDTGIVFVLVPGGTFDMGAQPDDPLAPNFRAEARPDEKPVHAVELAPFFLARHELTQGQWRRLSNGEEPSWYRPGYDYSGIPVAIGYTHPVEQVSLLACMELAGRHGLTLPTEAQWEYTCRAETPGPWWTGAEPDTLWKAANVLDKQTITEYSQWGETDCNFADGFAGPAPVGSFKANPWGFFDCHGNILEWCRDPLGSYRLPHNPGDGLLLVPPEDGPVSHAIRGGDYQARCRHVATTNRGHLVASFRDSRTGVRLARVIQR